MKKYRFEVIITEGNDEFWDSIAGKPGCEEVLEVIKDGLFTVGFDTNYDTEIKLIEFTDKE